MHCFAFDIETVPDTELGRKLYDLEGLDDDDVAKAMFALRKQQTGDEFLALHFHRIVAISVAMRTSDNFRVWSLGELDADEPELIRRFYDGLERYTPDLVSWNGSGFDLPVLQYRALRHGIAAPRYWEVGDDDQSFRWNNYLNRFHWRHLDLMDVLSGFQGRARAPLDHIAVMLGLPGKLGMSGADVWDAFRSGQLQAIRDYCETDVLNTYLIYLRFEQMRGRLTDDAFGAECNRVRETLRTADKPHFSAFLQAWVAE